MSQSATPSNQLPEGGDPFEGTPYRWLQSLGGGGMGEVHLVMHAALGSEFVAKVLHAKYASHEQLADRVRVEAQSLARLEHPNIVRVHSFGRLRDGRPFLIMEPLSGYTLGSEIQTRKRLPVVEALRYGLQLASALAAAHAIGIVHRDIKPDNLFLHHEHDGTKVLKVLDFGVARIVPGVSEQSPIPLAVPTDTGVVVGTPRYVSPEAAVGKRVDHRADIYGAGVVLYIMLTGRGPFDHVRGERAVLAAHVHQTPAPLATHAVEGVTAELEALVLHALAKNPDNRLSNAKELEQRLAALLQVVVRPQAQTTAPLPAVAPRPPSADASPAPQPQPAFSSPPPAARPPRDETPKDASSVRASTPHGDPDEALDAPGLTGMIPTSRSPVTVVLFFFLVALVMGCASAGAVYVIHRSLGGP